MMRRSKPRPDEEPAPTASDCRRAAMDLLARREHARAELEHKLSGKGYADSLIAPVLDQLTDDRLLDEARFAESFVVSRARRGQGPVRIKGDLRQRGVPDAMIDAAMVAAGVDWAQVAKAVQAAKFGDQMSRDYTQWARQARFLQYRGFTMEQIHAALDETPD